jgi:NAD(P)H-dependent FMN reductase
MIPKSLVRVVVGSIRQGRKSLAVAEYLYRRARERLDLRAELLDLADYPLPLLEERMGESHTSPAARELFQQLGDADGLLIVTPEYKGGVPGALKNAFDYFPPDFLRRKPVGICTVSAGGFGGVNCLAQLRLLTLAVGGLPIPGFLAVSKVNQVIAGGDPTLETAFAGKLDAFFEELVWYCEAMGRQRQRPELHPQQALEQATA